MLLQKKPRQGEWSAPPATGPQPEAMQAAPRRRQHNWILACVGVILLVLSLRGPLLLFAGSQVDGTITAVQEVPGNTENPYPSMMIWYQFTSEDGMQRQGSYSQPASLTRDNNPQINDGIRVRYARPAPWIHSAGEAEEIAVVSSVLLLCGAALIVFGFLRWRA